MNNDPITGFKVKFNILDYVDILPLPPERREDIINWDKPEQECKWVKQEIPFIKSKDFLEQEMDRVLRSGVWIYIRKQLVWLPPNYYFFLQYGTAGGEAPKFRLKRLKHVYFKIRVRKNARAIGTYTIKNRQDGETTMAIHDALWECMVGNMTVGQIGIQSKTNDDAKNPCWLTMKTLWQTLDEWFRDLFFPDFASKGAMEEKMVFESVKTDDKEARNIMVKYYPSVHNAMDGKNNMRKCILDEVNKWVVCSFYDTYINYKKFIAVGSSRRGLFDIFSSPSDTNGKHNDEALMFWKGSDPDDLVKETGSTATRVFRYYSNPLEGIEGFYDDYGDADADEIYAHIIQERKALPPDKVMAEIRAFPLNEQEMFGSFDGKNLWANTDGMKERLVFLIGKRFKDEISQEPRKIYGNLERVDGYMDGDVVFRPSGKETFDIKDGRFCFSYLPDERTKDKLKYNHDGKPIPPEYIENCTGLDPFNHEHTKKGRKPSNAAMVNRKFRDVYETGIKNVPTAIYCCRPQHINTVWEDCLKLAIFTRGLIQCESKSDKFAVYAEERGYSDWVLNRRDSSDPKLKGDAPGSGGAFLDEGIGLIDANTNVPLNPEDPYWLEQHWFEELITDYLEFDPADTHKYDLTMADIQSLIGCVKISHKKVKRKSHVNNMVLDFLLN